MKFTKFIRKEAESWNTGEIFSLFIISIIILLNIIVLHDSLIAACSALCGILYTIFAGKGKIYCYAFGLMGSGCYIWLSLLSHLWGNALLYLAYYIPMQIHGIFSWKKHLKSESVEIIKTKLTNKKRIKYLFIGIIGSIVSVFILKYFNDSSPFIDGITTFLSILGMYFTVKRLIEQWIIWMIVNGLSFLMWLNLILHGIKAYSTLVMWGTYFILAIYFYKLWEREISTKNMICKES